MGLKPRATSKVIQCYRLSKQTQSQIDPTRLSKITLSSRLRKTRRSLPLLVPINESKTRDASRCRWASAKLSFTKRCNNNKCSWLCKVSNFTILSALKWPVSALIRESMKTQSSSSTKKSKWKLTWGKRKKRFWRIETTRCRLVWIKTLMKMTRNRICSKFRKSWTA